MNLENKTKTETVIGNLVKLLIFFLVSTDTLSYIFNTSFNTKHFIQVLSTGSWSSIKSILCEMLDNFTKLINFSSDSINTSLYIHSTSLKSLVILVAIYFKLIEKTLMILKILKFWKSDKNQDQDWQSCKTDQFIHLDLPIALSILSYISIIQVSTNVRYNSCHIKNW